MKVLLIGSGGREHALAWALAASPHLTKLYAAPGNGGIANEAEIADIDTEDNVAVSEFCKANRIDLVVVGPEAPLAAGLADHLIAEGLRVFGPSQAAAQLESSKIFTKGICREANIPTADWAVFEDAIAAKSYVSERGAPIVVKADGLAAGKGVIVAATIDEAYAAIDTILDGSLDGEGGRVLIEDALEGEEVSVFALCDGETALYFGSAQDHKRVFDGDTGPNTGGMGAYSPAPILTDALRDQTMETIIAPTLKAMAARGTPFRGVIFAGLMLTESGPQLIEFNVRFGDPECQVLMMRLKDDLLLLLNAAVDGVLSTMSVRWRDETALTVVVASKGYPGSYEKGITIEGLGALSGIEDTEIFHSGTKKQGETYVSSGGRVLAVTVLGNSVREAQARAYEVTNRLNWPGGFFRRDIGWRAIAREAGPTS